MKKIWRGYQHHKNVILSLLGLLAVSLITLPYLVLGEGSYVQIHDQLDGEVLNYMYQARYLGQGSVIPEFMNGMGKASMLPPAPLGVLLYKLFPPFAAFGIMHWLCLTAGFLGMYGLGKRLGLRAEVSWAAACIFCYIPFYPVYGLAALGQPMLVLCGLRLWDQGRDKKALESDAAEASATGKKRVKPRGKRAAFWETGKCILGIVLYAAGSSLTLIGYVWVAVGFLWTAYLTVAVLRKKSALGSALRVGGGTAALLGVYLTTNWDLLRTLAGDGFATHRQEMVLQASEHPLEVLRELIFSGGSYSPVYSAGILAAAALLTLIAGILSVLNSKKTLGTGREKSEFLAKSLRTAWGMIGLIICAALLAVLWNCGPVVSLRLSIGGMVTYFQADRVYWCFPFLWMLVLGFLLESVCRLGERVTEREEGKLDGSSARKKAMRYRRISLAGCLMLLGAEGLQALRDSTLNKNIRLMLFKDYRQVTWESLFMDDVFVQIDEAIGADKDNYSVVSLGIYPSVALYHGYTCADGYSNNYDLNYKHMFRQIMAAELEENEEARRYFDDWGNRLYLAGAPYGINGMVAKGQAGYTDLDYDLDAMRSLNIRYLLAAAPVELSAASLEQTSLRLIPIEGSPFTDDTAYYEVWVYRVD
ncbi:MAG: hypothetical protein K2O34_06870 [Acetatifactor sp.]|nr:hypothetical protein [Acetatifactor sp.]